MKARSFEERQAEMDEFLNSWGNTILLVLVAAFGWWMMGHFFGPINWDAVFGVRP